MAVCSSVMRGLPVIGRGLLRYRVCSRLEHSNGRARFRSATGPRPCRVRGRDATLLQVCQPARESPGFSKISVAVNPPSIELLVPPVTVAVTISDPALDGVTEPACTP